METRRSFTIPRWQRAATVGSMVSTATSNGCQRISQLPRLDTGFQLCLEVVWKSYRRTPSLGCTNNNKTTTFFNLLLSLPVFLWFTRVGRIWPRREGNASNSRPILPEPKHPRQERAPPQQHHAEPKRQLRWVTSGAICPPMLVFLSERCACVFWFCQWRELFVVWPP